MQPGAALLDPVAIEALVSAVGKDLWRGRLAALAAASACRTHTGRDALQRFTTVSSLRIVVSRNSDES